jgi:hypothetical protein
MPDNMIKPNMGPYIRVKGSIKAIVVAGPNPGRIPTMVPRKTPIKQANTYFIEKNARKPFNRRSGMICFSSPLGQKPPR